MTFEHDSNVVREWYAQLAEASKTPGLAQHLVRRTGELFPRFATFYDRLRALPRRLRRALGRHRRLSLAGVAMLLALCGGTAWAATIVVDETTCRLWDAIQAANVDRSILGCTAGEGADVIVLNSDVTFAGVFPPIMSEMTIQAGTHSILDGAGHSGLDVWYFYGGPAVLSGLTLRNFDGPGVDNAGILTIVNCTISGNTGGGVENAGVLTIEGSAIVDNSASVGGGVYNHGSYLAIADSVISGNSAVNGGGIYSDGGTLNLARTVISGNDAAFDGGGIGLETYGSPTLNILDCRISSNTAGYMGGGIGSDAGGEGGGAAITIRKSTISGNTALLGGGLGSYGYSDNTVRLEQSTVSGNTATSLGGGIYQTSMSFLRCRDYEDTLSLVNATISNNESGEEGGGIFLECAGLSLSHSLITGNTAPVAPEMALDSSTGVAADAFNVVGYDGNAGSTGFTPGPTDLVPAAGVQVADILAPLADNGGSTPTHALVSGSPAIDVIPTSDPNCTGTTDQRGFSRPEGPGCDTGSVEIALEAPFGGSVTGFAPEKVACLDRTTGERKQSKFSGSTWSCEALGLAVSRGDKVQTSASGLAATSAIAGSVTRMTPRSVFCENATTGRKVTSRTTATTWDCQSLGLEVTPGDTVTTGASGIVD